MKLTYWFWSFVDYCENHPLWVRVETAIAIPPIEIFK